MIRIVTALILYVLAQSLALVPLLTTSRCSSKNAAAPLYQSTDPNYGELSSEEELNHIIMSKENRRKQQWITCSSTKELANAIEKMVKPGDDVAELGSQLREVSTAICEAIQGQGDNNNNNNNTIMGSGSAVLVDKVRKFPKDGTGTTRTRAMRRAGEEANFYPHCAQFYEIDQLEHWRQAFFFRQNATTSLDDNPKYYNVLVLDVNSIVGNDLEWTTLSIIREFLAINPSCRLVMVKSLSLNQLASRLVHGQRWCLQGGSRKAVVDNASVHERSQLCHVVATVGVQEYRDTIPYTVRPGDRALEIGCHLGVSTALINKQATKDASSSTSDDGYCIGVDIGSKIIKGARNRFPDLFFQVGDAWRTAALLRIQQDFLQISPSTSPSSSKKNVNQQSGFDVIYVDVGGLSGEDGVIEALGLISALGNALEPRAIVIKSQCMRRLSSVLTPYWRLQKEL